MFRIFVQGDRNAKGIEEQVRQLGVLCSEEGIGLNVGESGEIVRILSETGASVRVHQAKTEKANVAPGGANVEVLDFSQAELHTIGYTDTEGTPLRHAPPSLAGHVFGWSVRLAYIIGTSDGFIFFPGAEGTMAHIIPTIAHIAKGERDKGVRVPRRVALIGWEQRKVDALVSLMDLDPRRDYWLRAFDLHRFGRSTLLFVMEGFRAGVPTETKP